ncbi:nuclear transport factor 2 family protein [Olivibacter domesticus]|uniref:Putative lumazine-binding n=1 Tax=Olivibacter domesticus TaxID=407022 RepID=A0A1H7H936_OLID1|nr:nuclear transport factor 2 family protein [Olivibacter domesticus]SEK44625.1 Putative lumazine-binding [Olivibacter domesticus]
MKTFITTIVVAFMLTSGTFATTIEKVKRSKIAAINLTLEQYTNAVSKGQVAGIDQLFCEQFHQRYTGKKKTFIFNKSELVGFLKGNKNFQQDCETDYSIVDENNGMAIAKVTMKYRNFSRVDYVTISQNGVGYQISQIVSTFE